MKKLLSLTISFIILAGFLTACGGTKVSQGTMEDCAKTFVKALINADEKTLNSINKSNSLSFPTNHLLSEVAPDFKRYKISDFSFSTDEENGYVNVKSSDGKKKLKIELKKVNKKFYYFDMKEAYTRGNTVGNSINDGLVAKQDNWIYYTTNKFELYKTCTDGTGKTKLCDDINADGPQINVVGDWVYYVGDDYTGNNDKIYRIKTDGTKKEKISDDKCDNMSIVGEWIYYTNESDNGKIYKIRIDGTNKTKLNDDISGDMNVFDDWIYYNNYNDSNNIYIYKIKIDGSSRTKISDVKGRGIKVVGDWVYFANSEEWKVGNYIYSGKLYKMRIDGSEITKLNDDEACSYINVSGDWIYYLGGNMNDLYKIRIDGSQKTKLSDKTDFDTNVVDDWVYARYNKGIVRVRIDGSGWQVVD